MSAKQQSIPPNQTVLEMFGISGKPVLLEGGEGLSYLAGDIVLKPTTEVLQADWIADVMGHIREEGFRVNKAVKTLDGEWVFGGWHAFHFVEGKHIKGNWKEKIALSRIFHAQLKGIKRPDFIGKRAIPWETADRVVWEGEDQNYGEKVRVVANRLLSVKKPLSMDAQLIHGDMTGNILFHDSLPPAIIDFSPYWRPAEYATAIIIVDAVVWEGADDSLFSSLENTFEHNQLLIRAALWRIKTTDEFSKIHLSDPIDEILHYSHFIDVLLNRIETERSR